MTSAGRRGFTLVELLVVVVLGGLMILAIYQVLITNTRVYAANNAQVQGQQSLRAGLEVLFGELREISAKEGDIIGMGPDSITIRASRAFGLVCATDYATSPPSVTAHRVGPMVQPGDSIFIFADNDPDRTLDDTWLTRLVQNVDGTATCSGQPGQRLTVPNLATGGDTVRLGAPLRAFVTYTYRLHTFGGEDFLGRRLASSGSPDPLVGPLIPNRGLSFRYLDSIGAVTTNPSEVARIEVTLRYQSDVLDSRNQRVRDSIVTWVYPRN
jgi:prepilin-type N-terminal cleavage/methylation domain-containing protein